jgi:hypothetical protein
MSERRKTYDPETGCEGCWFAEGTYREDWGALWCDDCYHDALSAASRLPGRVPPHPRKAGTAPQDREDYA